MTPLTGRKNLGPKIIATLKTVGITTLEDIENIGPADIYKRLQGAYPRKMFPICYYLYSLEGALEGKHWNDIGKKRKMELLNAIGRV